MFEGRFGELLVIFVLALVILGPEKLPKVVAELGRWVGRARTMARQFREQLEEEVRIEETRKAQAAAPKPTPAPASPENVAPSVDVGAALNPHTTQQPSPIDVTGLPPELAQAAQQADPVASAHVPTGEHAASTTAEAGAEPLAQPAASSHTPVTPAQSAAAQLASPAQPASEGQA
jgi:sec-independent protein translocase protein TatB